VADGPQDRRWAGVVRLTLVSGLAVLYVLAFHVRPVERWLGETGRWLREPSVGLAHALRTVVDNLGPAGQQAALVRDGLYFLVTGLVVPYLIMALSGRWRPADLGLRIPNRFGWRWLLVGYVLAFPFQIWMVRSPTFYAYYRGQLEAGAPWFGSYYLVNMVAEHFLYQGVLLAVLRRERRWPARTTPEPGADGRRHPWLQWLGWAQSVGQARGWARWRSWLGLPEGCLWAVLVSGLLFAAIHAGKNERELLLSLPGGLALAYLAYRTDSWLVPFALHLSTAGTAAVLMVKLAPAP